MKANISERVKEMLEIGYINNSLEVCHRDTYMDSTYHDNYRDYYDSRYDDYYDSRYHDFQA